MSIKVMSYLWENSEQSGSKLLVLLALADSANDDGVCYPGLSYIAHKARLSVRQTQNIIRELERSNVLMVLPNAGIKTDHGSTNRYVIPTDFNHEYVAAIERETRHKKPRKKRTFTTDDKDRIGVKRTSGVQSVSPLNARRQVQSVSPQGVQSVSPNPSEYPLVSLYIADATDKPSTEAPQPKPVLSNQDAWYGCMVEMHDIHKARAINHAKYLAGVADGKAAKDCALEPPFDGPEQYKEFIEWYKDKYPQRTLPLSYELVQSYHSAWLKDKENEQYERDEDERARREVAERVGGWFARHHGYSD